MHGAEEDWENSATDTTAIANVQQPTKDAELLLKEESETQKEDV